MPPPYETKCIKAGNLESDDLIIALMGPTGSGKSQIIDTLTGQPGERAKANLQSTYKDITACRVLNHEIFGCRLVLIETPGVDPSDARRSTDGKILEMIGKWLSKGNASLSGIIYTHKISDNRMTGQLERNLTRFAGSSADQWAQGIALVTTMWDKINHNDSEKREEQLRNGYWKVMINKGAVLHRLPNTDSAWSIISSLEKVPCKIKIISEGKGWVSFVFERVENLFVKHK